MAETDADRDQRPDFRLHVLGIVAVCLVAALFARLWYLQVLQSEELRAAASDNILRFVHVEAPRGRIFDADGRILVDNRVVQVVVVDRKEMQAALDDGDERFEALRQLAAIVSRSGRLTKVGEIIERLESREFGPFEKVPVALDIGSDLVVYLGEHADLLPGVAVEERTVRTYPYGDVAAHVLGYVGPLTASEYQAENARIDPADPGAKTYEPGDEIGKTGVERIFESELRGVPGQRVLEVNARNEVVRERYDLRREPRPGNDVHLTIDLDVQSLVERELRNALDVARNQKVEADYEGAEFAAPAGAAVALDPRDGSVLAMASFPTYDPRDFVNGISQQLFDDLTAAENYSPILNRAIQGLYAPGSTFKVVTAFAALTQGVIAPDEAALIAVDEFYNDTGTYRYPFCVEEDATCLFESPYCCERGVDLRDALVVSSDTYFYRVGGEGFFGRERPLDEGIQETARLFGLGTRTGVALPYERPGVVPDRDYYDYQFSEGVFLRSGAQWYPGDTINLAIGQGNLLTTPLQMANLYAVLAGDGRLHQPNIAARISDRSGATVNEFGPRLVRQLDWSSETVDPLLDGLNGVTAYRLPAPLGDGSLLQGTAYAAFNLPGEGGVDFPLTAWPVAGKTGTAEVRGKADFAWFAAFGPAAWPEQGYDHTPEVVVAMVLEEAGFGGEVAAPAVARILHPIATGAVERARTAQEVDACYAEVKTLVSFLEGVRSGAIKVDEEGLPISQPRPSLSQDCLDLVGGEENVEALGMRALL